MSRRVKQIEISPLVLLWIMQDAYTSNIPKDAIPVEMHCVHGHQMESIFLTIESESFDEIIEGEEIPLFYCEFKRRNNNA